MSDRDKLIELISYFCEHMPHMDGQTWEEACADHLIANGATLQTTPTADVEEVVRCKDCQWYGHKRACPLAASGLSADCVKLPKEDDFFSYGEMRKENG